MKIMHPAKARIAGDLLRKHLPAMLESRPVSLHGFVVMMREITFHVSESSPDRSNQLKGEMWEIFCEFFIKSHGLETTIGISQYKPLNTSNGDEDWGVDGTGIGTNGKPATVQCKFKANPNYVLTSNEDSLSNFAFVSQNAYGVDREDTMNMLVITSGKGIATRTLSKLLCGKVRCLGFAEISEKVGNGEHTNVQFWRDFLAALQAGVPVLPARKLSTDKKPVTTGKKTEAPKTEIFSF